MLTEDHVRDASHGAVVGNTSRMAASARHRKKFAVIGDPIDHSLSPRMHTAALSATRIHATYEPMRVDAAELPEAILRLRDEGYSGFNVTIPHKQSILPLLDDIDALARQTGAVNTVVREGLSLIGYNTDVEGFDMALKTLAGRSWRGRSLILGAGGAARAVLLALQRRDGTITISNRTVAAAESLAKEFGDVARVLRDPADLPEVLRSAELVVNATALGMGKLGGASPVPQSARFQPGTLVIDLVYGRRTPFLAAAEAAGCRVQDGIEMLVQQGAAAFHLWTGIRPDTDVMRDACLGRVREVAP